MCHGLAQARSDTVQDDVDLVVVGHLDMHINSIDIAEVYLDRTHLLAITDLVNNPVQLVLATIIFPNSLLDHLPGSMAMSMIFPLFQFFCFHVHTNECKLLLLIVGLCNAEVIIHL